MLFRYLIAPGALSIALAMLLASDCTALAAAADVEPPQEKCRAQLPETDQQQPGQTDPGQTGSTSTTGKLDPCDGILKPPATGDQEMTQPPPATGEMPIIRPGDLPQQQPNPQN